MKGENSRRAVITGCGAVSALGCGVGAFWDGLVNGRSGLRPITSLDASAHAHPTAGEVLESDVARLAEGKGLDGLDRIALFALAAAREAIGAAKLDLDRVDRTRMGLVVGTTLGAMAIGESYLRARHAGESTAPRLLLNHPYYATANRLARELGVRGPVVSPSIACASGTQAVGQAVEFIQLGYGDLFVVGGAEALCDFVVNGFDCLRATTGGTVRPFDRRRDGLLVGEGAAMLVIESEAHARSRGLAPDVAVTGAGLSGDAVHMTAPARDGAGAARAMRAALRDAGAVPSDVDFISAHGTGTVYNDAMEVAAIEAVFGPEGGGIPVNSIKGAIGHTLAAAGSFEAILCTEVIRRGVIPPTAHCEDLDPACRLDIVRGQARTKVARTVLSTSSAFAGNNAAIVLREIGSR